MKRVIVNLDVKKRMGSMVEIQKFISGTCTVASRLTLARTRTSNEVTHPIISFVEFSRN